MSKQEPQIPDKQFDLVLRLICASSKAVQASTWTMIKARMFGKRSWHKPFDDDREYLISEYKGKEYMLNDRLTKTILRNS